MLAALEVCITTEGSCSSANPLLVTLLPAVIGAVLGFAGALTLRRGERAWQRERERFLQEMEIIKPMDEALVEAARRISGYEVGEGESRFGRAHQEWEVGWVRFTPHVTDEDLEARYRAVGTVLMELRDHEDMTGKARGTPMMIAMRAVGGARLALAYWLRGEKLPPASFPVGQELIDLLGHGDPTPFAAGSPLRTWLDQHEPPPWRAPVRRPWWRRGRR